VEAPGIPNQEEAGVPAAIDDAGADVEGSDPRSRIRGLASDKKPRADDE
jgi:hypothetical protein